VAALFKISRSIRRTFTSRRSSDSSSFSAVVSAPAFAGISRIAQHRLVYDVFGAELGERIHALSIQTKTSETEEAR